MKKIEELLPTILTLEQEIEERMEVKRKILAGEMEGVPMIHQVINGELAVLREVVSILKWRANLT